MFREGHHVEKNKRRCEKTHRFFHRFSIAFGWKIDEKTFVFFKPPSHFFQHGDPHETLYFTMRKLLFHFLSFCFFFQKNVQNWVQNWTQKKIEKNNSTGTQNDPKIDKKSIGKSWKSLKWPKKVVFGRIDFLMIFWVAQKSKKGGMTIIDLSVLLALGSTGGL